MIWVIGFLILIVFLMIPILAIVLDSPVLHRLAESRRSTALDDGEVEEFKKRLGVLEDEVADLGQALESLKEETQFIQRLLESGDGPPRLPPSA
ncbi:MAG: cell division protein ZapB [Gemmatimonadota bacterium]|nr:cell division protein ZapB [Gemmatimonadota bacterium]